MMASSPAGVILSELDAATRGLVRLSAVVAGGAEDEVREALRRAVDVTPQEWIEELLLQTYLFAGFPRALNAMREWRRLSRTPAIGSIGVPPVRRRGEGERTCARVYGSMYDRLRINIRELHPHLDDWMIEEGYGKVLSRPALDLPRRELCIVAACVASGQDRQLQSHLHGSLNVGVAPRVITEALTALETVVSPALHGRATRIWQRIQS